MAQRDRQVCKSMSWLAIADPLKGADAREYERVVIEGVGSVE